MGVAGERRCPPLPASSDWASRMRIRIGAVGGSSTSRIRRLRRMRAAQGHPPSPSVWRRCHGSGRRLRGLSLRAGAVFPPALSPRGPARRWEPAAVARAPPWAVIPFSALGPSRRQPSPLLRCRSATATRSGSEACQANGATPGSC